MLTIYWAQCDRITCLWYLIDSYQTAHVNCSWATITLTVPSGYISSAFRVDPNIFLRKISGFLPWPMFSQCWTGLLFRHMSLLSNSLLWAWMSIKTCNSMFNQLPRLLFLSYQMHCCSKIIIVEGKIILEKCLMVTHFLSSSRYSKSHPWIKPGDYTSIMEFYPPIEV